tara:strand:+ start:7751 stop:8317 length:567 start_codon:yes stop_codon:yes gene_type:complete
MKTPAQIEQRLAEIEAERDELAAIDFDAEMRQATINGGDLDAIEQRQADAERKERRLKIEAEALNDHLPDARREAAKPSIEAIKKRLDERKEKARKAAAQAQKAAASLKQAMAEFYSASSTEDLRGEMGAIAKEIDANLEAIGSISHQALSNDLAALQNDIHRCINASMKRGGHRLGDPASIDVSKAA